MVFIAEKVNGIVRFVDSQTGNPDVSSYFGNGEEGQFGFLRMDDKEIISDSAILNETVEAKNDNIETS